MGTEAYFEATNTAVAGTTSACDGFHQAPKEYGGDAALLVLIEGKSGCRRSCPECWQQMPEQRNALSGLQICDNSINCNSLRSLIRRIRAILRTTVHSIHTETTRRINRLPTTGIHIHHNIVSTLSVTG